MSPQESSVQTLLLPPAGLQKLIREQRLFAVLDACDAPSVLEKVQSMGEDEAPCLFRGSLDEETLAVAPYLVRMTGDLIDWLTRSLWQEPWGIFVIAESNLADVRRHLRRLLMVEGPEGAALFFRFYDPRVLRTFCSNCERDEAQQLFGPLQAFGVAGEEGANVHLFYL